MNICQTTNPKVKITQLQFNQNQWHAIRQDTTNTNMASLVLCFGSKQIIAHGGWRSSLADLFPKADIIACSTAGEFNNVAITDNSLVATALQFDKGRIVSKVVHVNGFADSHEAGKALAGMLDKVGLRMCLLFSDGALVNGQELVDGTLEVMGDIPVAGGLAGDGADFKSTLVGLNSDIKEGNIVAVGFYGTELKIGFGSMGGWAEFGPTRTITKSNQNVLFEIDNAPALELYKRYLGPYASELPGSALLFPLALTDENKGTVVRTILSVNESQNSMTFAGNMPEGAQVRMMKTTLENLAEAAAGAALKSVLQPSKANSDSLAILISCVGRKAVFGSRIDEEFEAVRHALGQEVVLAGFYSYGEISPGGAALKCQLHNQTMTITTLSEA